MRFFEGLICACAASSSGFDFVRIISEQSVRKRSQHDRAIETLEKLAQTVQAKPDDLSGTLATAGTTSMAYACH